MGALYCHAQESKKPNITLVESNCDLAPHTNPLPVHDKGFPAASTIVRQTRKVNKQENRMSRLRRLPFLRGSVAQAFCLTCMCGEFAVLIFFCIFVQPSFQWPALKDGKPQQRQPHPDVKAAVAQHLLRQFEEFQGLGMIRRPRSVRCSFPCFRRKKKVRFQVRGGTQRWGTTTTQPRISKRR